ncbi:hypothetical protein P0W64_17685 [Tsukamurella sp. 8F]|uniref:hypothetical protein n=1 Tax=unclassified Tsukamurella TaxID=2633480 RepID=UPI0023B9FE01|nr:MULTISPECIES: hypothetical protein [unclassified Tsukamurella]MDF0532396.1 hypothetical protein [Tsukamurella sp. 8J]MDF0588618.1 hypothetical protein [Tsukamurella sp. 8F]
MSGALRSRPLIDPAVNLRPQPGRDDVVRRTSELAMLHSAADPTTPPMQHMTQPMFGLAAAQTEFPPTSWRWWRSGAARPWRKAVA